MKTKKVILNICAIVFLSLMLGFPFLIIPQHTTSATAQQSVISKDSNFSMEMTATARKKTASLLLSPTKTSTTIGEEKIDYTFYSFQWRDIEYLRFRFTSTIADSHNNFTKYQFKLAYIQAESIDTSFGNGEEIILNQSNISTNTFDQIDYYYYIDSDVSMSESNLRSKGKDFGLYKFDFVYTYSDEEVSNVEKSIGEICVAIIPDDIDKITYDSMQILYTVSSSKKLMNVYNLYLSKDYYKYVNPKYLEWIVIGTDRDNFNYAYSKQICENNIAYANYKSIWINPPQDAIGTNFTFDSNDIEGTWTAYCVIKNSRGEEVSRLTVENLSTIKNKESSPVWIILISILAILIASGIIGLIVFYAKRKKS